MATAYGKQKLRLKDEKLLKPERTVFLLYNCEHCGEQVYLSLTKSQVENIMKSFKVTGNAQNILLENLVIFPEMRKQELLREKGLESTKFLVKKDVVGTRVKGDEVEAGKVE